MPKKQANPVDAHVGHRVRLRRMLVGMSQERLGELLGLTFQQVQKYEKGVNRIGAGRLYELAGILGVPVSFFYEGMNGAGGPQVEGAEQPQPQPGGRPPAVMEFVATGEGLQLSLAFMRIRDGKVRRKILDLVRSLGEDDETEDAAENHQGHAAQGQ